jgi:HSP20 family protein
LVFLFNDLDRSLLTIVEERLLHPTLQKRGGAMATRDRRDFQGISRRPPGSSSPSGRDPYSSSGAYALDPFTHLRRLSEQMDRWFDTMGFGRTGNRSSGMSDSPWTPEGGGTWAPELETFLRDDQFVLRMDLPGVDKEDVRVEVTDDAIVVHGERQQTHQEERDGFYRSERSYGRFYREVQLPEGAQPDTAKANYRDGVLEVSVTAPPRQLTRPRRIEIGSSSTGEKQERQRTASTGRASVAHDTGE